MSTSEHENSKPVPEVQTHFIKYYYNDVMWFQIPKKNVEMNFFCNSNKSTTRCNNFSSLLIGV